MEKLISPSNDTSAEFKQMLKVLQKYTLFSEIKVALDVGSRDALVALKMKHVFKGADIFAFECNPGALDLCRRNVAGHERVVIVDRAVADSNGPVTFFSIDPEKTITPHADGNIGASSLLVANAEYPFETYVQKPIQVEAVTLKSWALSAGVTKIDFIWMDLQGAELKALFGLEDFIASVNFIYLEVEYKPIYKEQPLAGEIYEFMRKKGFVEVAVLHRDDWMGNVLFRRAEKKALFWATRFFDSLRALLTSIGRV